MLEKFRFYFPFCIFLFSVFSVFLVCFYYVSIIISSLCLIFSFIFSRKRFRLFLVTVFISFSTIITCIFILYKERSIFVDKYEGVNIVLGNWLYNEYGGTYIFRDNNIYYQYYNENNNDNYCVGKYEYSYGGIGDDGIVIRQDDNFYYYNLNLTEDYCIINGDKNISNHINEMVFAIGKDKNTTLLIDKASESVFILSKIHEDN